MKLGRFDVLCLAASALGAWGWYLVWPPLAPLFLAAVLFVLAALVDRRTIEPIEGGPP